jgi:hypothetical protein
MSTSPATASRWTCDRCEMSASMQSGEQTELPSGWISAEEGLFCLICRRERAAEAAPASPQWPRFVTASVFRRPMRPRPAGADASLPT